MRLAAATNPTVLGLAVLSLLGTARAEDIKPEPATSDRARVAPGPSERNEPAAPEVRQTPVGGQTGGGQTGGGTGGKPDTGEPGKRP
jgi:hypothetical protein